MAEGAKTQWLIRGRRHWMLAVMAWVMTLLAGDKLGGGEWRGGIIYALAGAMLWIGTLRGKRGQD